jgi:hypothetical protein
MRRAWIIAGVAAAGFAALTVLDPRAGAGGWLIGFVTTSGVLIGALVWCLIGRLTGGAWARTPALRALANATPAVSPVLLLLLIATPRLYPWARGGAAVTDYLSPLAWAGRGVLTLGVLGAISLLKDRMPGRLFAGVSLVFYGATVGLMATDWLFSLQPGWISSAGGMALAVQQLGSALAAALMLGVDDDRRRRDLTGLLVATLLGALYFDLMSYIVVWYGDQADKTAFYGLRAASPWPGVMMVIIGAGRLAPIVLIALQKRFEGVAVFGAAILALAGFWLETTWMVAPETGGLSVITGALAVIALGGAFMGRPRRMTRAEVVHA